MIGAIKKNYASEVLHHPIQTQCSKHSNACLTFPHEVWNKQNTNDAFKKDR